MLVKHEIKSQLAKLLATEDLIVEHRKVDTAQFNVHTRVLVLPLWEKASNDVYDMLVGHEVGHALFTPDRDYWLERKIPPQFVNVVEDARIEKLMKRKYMGLAKCFNRGYNELNNQDFFEIENEDLSNFNLADRANLYFKVGSFLPIIFSSIEEPIIRLIGDCETFDDTLDVAEKLYLFCKQEELVKHDEKDQEGEREDGNIKLEGDTQKDLDDMTDEELLEELNKSKPDNDPADLDTPSFSKEQGGQSSDPELKTVEALQDSLKDLSGLDGRENSYVELPVLDLKDIIISNKTIHDGIRESFIHQENEFGDREKPHPYLKNLFQDPDNNFIKFKKNAQKEISYMVKEFECRKSADAYARSTTARTGVLDTVKLHTYKFNEDLFKKVTVVPDGKSHGLVFILDWSGSMGQVMKDTLKQLYNLMWFCKKVQIPFEVYAFTNNYPPADGGYHKNAYTKKEGLVLVDETFSLMHMFTSKVNNKVLEEQMKHIFRLGCCFGHDYYCPFEIPVGMNLSGTPLNETLIALHQILPQFKKENSLQKVQCVILTDGEGQSVRYSKEFQRRWDDLPYMGSSYFDDSVIIRNRKTGYTYSCKDIGRWGDISDILLKDLRQTFSDMNFIGIRILGSRDAGHFVRHYTGYMDDSYEKIMKRWRKEKSFSIKNSGYHTYFGLASQSLSNEDEIEVGANPTKGQIKSAFMKSLKSKKMNKKILGEFIELVA